MTFQRDENVIEQGAALSIGRGFIVQSLTLLTLDPVM